MSTNSQEEKTPLELIISRTIADLKESGVFDEASLSRIETLVEEHKLSHREAVKDAIRSGEGETPMKLISLGINQVRGIRDVNISPGGSSFAIWGPNGSGKSAVVDALDFLLTGRISRLEGKGTQGISLKEHGPHIDVNPEDAIVCAVLDFEGVDDGIEISRCMDNPGQLIIDEAVYRILEPILRIAKRGQHVLSRRDILRFITADASSRAEGIQELLNISEVENIRKSLVNVRNDGKNHLKDAEDSLNTAKAAIAVTIQLDKYDEPKTLEFANNQRGVLGAKNVDNVNSSTLKSDLTLPKTAEGGQSINVTIFQRDLNNLLQISEVASKKITADHLSQLRSAIKDIHSDPQLSQSLSRMRLLLMGKDLLDNSGDCPLCETEWPEGVLETQIDERLSKASIASGYSSQIIANSAEIKNSVLTAEQSLEKVLSALKVIDAQDKFPRLTAWKVLLNDLKTGLDKASREFTEIKFSNDEVEILLAPDKIFEDFPLIQALVSNAFPETTPEQTAWDSLTRLEENLKALEIAQASYDAASLYQIRSERLHDAFISSRNEVLGELYNNIRDRFVELYRFLHGPDEDNFEATIEPAGAGLSLEVGFYGRGSHPPHALHSEGHQDSMGLCLYLALAEHLHGNEIKITILDDVIMSVDSGHRRKVCNLLKEFFPDKQFIITTHDKNWAYQMRTEGLVTSKNSIEFYKWDIDSGPYVNYEADLWSKVSSFVDNNDVPNAAILLRRGSEQFLAEVCDSLEAPVKYRLDGRNDLGDFFSAAIGKFKRLVRKAKSAAHSWSKDDEYAALVEFESIVGQVVSQTQSESWAVNAPLHFNNWESLAPGDFIPVRDAFQDLHLIFLCSECKSIVRIAKERILATNVRCQCAKINWDLIPKGKS